ncbi:hypothetical protein D7Y11_00700 [Corallococcus sp. AB018]|nr:hypothetical protein D7Y11_00700 [Corallococcus sp. AB018]
MPRIEPSVVLELPPRGSVVQATLGDGTPLWVVHRADGTVSVFSALIPRTSDEVSVGLTYWIPRCGASLASMSGMTGDRAGQPGLGRVHG